MIYEAWFWCHPLDLQLVWVAFGGFGSGATLLLVKAALDLVPPFF
jgi:hypothetical protein